MSTLNQEHTPSYIPTGLRVPKVNDSCVPIIKCPPDQSRQFIVLNGSELTIIKGYETKEKVDLRDFFVDCNSYSSLEVLIPAVLNQYEYEGEMYHNTDAEYSTIDYGLMKNESGKVSFIMIYPQYFQSSIDDQSLWVMKFRFQGETDWRDLGRIFMWSSSEEGSVPPIEIINPTGVDIYTKIIFGN